MQLLEFALRRPISVIVLMTALIGAGGLAYSRMKVDIFPSLNLPVIYVCQPYGGMDPLQMEGLITYYYEYHFLYINGIHHVESKNVQGMSLMKLFFHPGTDMAQAMAETVLYVNRSRAFMPPGTVPPFIMRFDTGSVPVGYLVLSSDRLSIEEIQDKALNRVRPMFAAIPGVSAPPPFGGSQRTIVIRADPDRLRSYNLSPDDVIQALVAGNTISPSGNIRTSTSMPLVPVNTLVVQPRELGDILVRPGVFLRDVAPVIEDASDIVTGYALVNGRRAVYIAVTKRANASTLDVVRAVKAELPRMQAVLDAVTPQPGDIQVRFEFDQSPYVTRALRGVVIESVLAAVLVGLMVLLFLRDWRSVLVVVFNIPLALIAALIALALSGQTINLMTLGGLALAVGFLVDEATVEVENIHRQMHMHDSVAAAVWRGNQETRVPRLLAMATLLAVFIPALFMRGVAQSLFVPLALAVAFAMIASYLLSSTFVPVVSVWWLRKPATPSSSAAGLVHVFDRLVGWTVRWRRWIVVAYLAGAVAGVVSLGSLLGVEIFPQADTGQLQFRLRAPAGTRIEQTEAIARETLEFIRREVGPENVAISLGYVGVIPSSYPINAIYLWTSGPEEAVMRIAFREGTVRLEELKERLRQRLPQHLRQWAARQWIAAGEDPQQVEARLRELSLTFEPADIINQVMSLGASTPIEVAVSGPKMADLRAYCEKLHAELQKIPALRDLQFAQPLDYPTVEVTIDRQKAGVTGVRVEEVARSLVAATSSSRFVVPVFWRDPSSGLGYQVQVEIPQAMMRSPNDVATIPVKQNLGAPILLRDVAEVRAGSMPGEVDRYNMRRMLSLTANLSGEDLGRMRRQLAQAIAAAGEPPPGVQVDIRGQLVPMDELLEGLEFGLAVAVIVILLLLTGYFQSLRLALTVVAVVPAVLLGVVLVLLLTGTTLNLQSFIGAIMAIGVAVANAILLVAFAEQYRRAGWPADDAVRESARTRLRAIAMTALAMIAGMVPMAVGLGEGGEQTAPLGRAVIGGLIASTATTLLVLPAVFAALMRRASVVSPSLSPTDPQSRYYSPEHVHRSQADA